MARTLFVVFFATVLAVFTVGVAVYVLSSPIQVKFEVEDAISLQLSILQTLIGVGGVIFAILGLYGYSVIRDTAIEKAEAAAKETAELISREVAKQVADQVARTTTEARIDYEAARFADFNGQTNQAKPTIKLADVPIDKVEPEGRNE